MKTIFISSFHALISRNILQTSMLADLGQNVKVVILTHEKKTEYFKRTFVGKNVFIEGVDIPKRPLENLMQMISFGLVGVENHIVRGWKTERKYFKYYFTHALYALCSRFFIFHKVFRSLAKRYLRTDIFEGLFLKYNPDLVFATDSFDNADRLLLLEAEKKGIKTLGMIRSWDNPTTKGVFLPNPSHIVVTNDVVKEEMIAIHHVQKEKVTVVGVPHYDKVLQPRTISRGELFKKVGLDPKKKTIFFSPGGKMLYKHDAEVMALFKKQLDERSFSEPIQFLVSIQPGDTINTATIEGDSRFILYQFGTEVTERRKENEMSPDENNRLNDLIFYSDILVTLVSTMAIDGTVFGKPVIVLGFDPKPGLPDKMSKFAKYKHFEKFLGTGFVTVAHSKEEFAQEVNAFLSNPDLSKEKREALMSRYIYKLDGNSTKRLTECVLSVLGD